MSLSDTYCNFSSNLSTVSESLWSSFSSKTSCKYTYRTTRHWTHNIALTSWQKVSWPNRTDYLASKLNLHLLNAHFRTPSSQPLWESTMGLKKDENTSINCGLNTHMYVSGKFIRICVKFICHFYFRRLFDASKHNKSHSGWFSGLFSFPYFLFCQISRISSQANLRNEQIYWSKCFSTADCVLAMRLHLSASKIQWKRKLINRFSITHALGCQREEKSSRNGRRKSRHKSFMHVWRS